MKAAWLLAPKLSELARLGAPLVFRGGDEAIHQSKDVANRGRNSVPVAGSTAGWGRAGSPDTRTGRFAPARVMGILALGAVAPLVAVSSFERRDLSGT